MFINSKGGYTMFKYNQINTPSSKKSSNLFVFRWTIVLIKLASLSEFLRGLSNTIILTFYKHILVVVYDHLVCL